MVSAAALGKMPVYYDHAAMEVVGIEDAARAFLLAAQKEGRVGERYIISDRYMTWKELLTGRRPKRAVRNRGLASEFR